MRILKCPLAVVALAPWLANAATLENDTTRITVDDAGRMVELVNKKTGWNWCGGGALWRLYFDRRFTPAGTPTAAVREEKEIPVGADGQDPRVTIGENRIAIEYSALTVRGERLRFGLRLTITLEPDGQVCFGSEIRNDEPHTIIRELHYPLVYDCRLPPGAEWLNTQLGGQRIKDPVKRIARPGQSPLYMIEDQRFRQYEMEYYFTMKYPAHTTANCYAFITEKEGLYFGSHDPTFQDTIHLMRCWPDAKGAFTVLEAGLAKYPNVLHGASWRNEANVICPYVGNWTATAKRYRSWANTWWKKRKVPDWVNRMTGWHRTIFRHQYGATYYSPADLNGRIRRAGDAAGLDTMLCFGWWGRGMDNGYPDSYFSCDDTWASEADWKREIAAYRASGHNFLLYFNGKLIDTESDYFRNGPGRRIALKTNTGETYVEQYRFAGTGTFTRLYNTRTFASADHRSPEWRAFLRKAVDRAVAFGASGVFFDQLGYCEPTTTWDLSGEFPIPQTRTIAAKAAALAELRDYIEEKGLHDFAIGTECFVDCCAQNVDYMHNLIGATGPDDFTDWARYAFPECVISDRCIRDDTDIAWRVNHNLLTGLRSDVEIWRCRGLIDDAPNYQKRLESINRLRAKYPVLLTGRFAADEGLSNVSEGTLLATVFTDGSRLCVVACTKSGKPAHGRLAVQDHNPTSWDGLDGAKVLFATDEVELDLPVDALAVISFERQDKRRSVE